MATIITNRATVNYNSGSATAVAYSNTTSTVLNGRLSIIKTSLSSAYRIGEELTYIVTVTNNGNDVARNVNVIDDLGTFNENQNDITPLDYVGMAQLFINGKFSSLLDATVGNDSVIFEIESIPARGNAQIIYRTRVNEFACFSIGATVTNTACAEFDCSCPCEETACDSFTVTVDEYADLRVTKTACPNPVACGERLGYTIDIYNYGNTDADEIIITDVFDPALEDISVALNGETLLSDKYRYVGGVLTISRATGSDITVPAATCSRDAETSRINIIPGKATVAVSGII